ncbi:fibroblast growth factor receptor 2 isoform X2 [Amyelois transitella]|uniref:fibroblast growth factor receptor 2 isoform X2 n=1 Tax=Amyelois transitella TaxID=680683 RepID=UPI00067C8364|nr:fibroblast growth factor receptor 2 isoform X2 [Amyelois transitella]
MNQGFSYKCAYAMGDRKCVFYVFVFLCEVKLLCVVCVAQQMGYPFEQSPGFMRPPPPGYEMHPRPPMWYDHDRGPDPPDLYPVHHAGAPRDLVVHPLPLEDSDHELKLNVSWSPSDGQSARDYSIEVRSVTETIDCKSPMCYEYNIPGDTQWWIIPAFTNHVAETCAVRPGCSYLVVLTAHPWDGHTVVDKIVQLDECVAGVCSCAHSPRLPAPSVSAFVVSIKGELFANISWTLPPPRYPQRLPRGLAKQGYFVSIGKQMVTDAHPSPWFANTVSRRIDADGPIATGDSLRWHLLPVNEPVGRDGPKDTRIKLDVKLLARVNLVDERGCVGPAGNSTAYDPDEDERVSYETYLLWAIFGGVCVLAMIALLAVSARAVKRILHAFRPAPVSDPMPHRQRAWFPLHLRSDAEVATRGQFEESPLYVHKEIESDEEGGDQWEVRRSRVHLGVLIGSGAFGRVHIAQLDTPSGETVTVAAKMLSETAADEELQDFLREITMLKHVGSHKHVIRLIGCCTRKTPLIALLEHAPRGDLLSLLRAARGKRRVDQGSGVTRRLDSDATTPRASEADTEYTNISDSDPALSEDKPCFCDPPRPGHHYVAEPALHLDGSTMRDYALQVALGMRHLEERGITHRDLAARNILVDGAGVLKVADFGLSRTGVYVHTRANPVPLRWLAPEAILHSQYCTASDVWAFAVLLWEIATLGGFPYAELSNHQVPAFLAGGSRLPKPARASPRLYQLMVECWSNDPNDRPTFAQIVDKLTAQRQLYVDLECVLPPSEEDVALEYNFTSS